MEKCQCDSPGFCDYFQKEMAESPPNWQWCQNATKEEREKHWEDNQKKLARARAGPWNPEDINDRFITTASMIEDCKKYLLPKLAKLNIKGVIGVPRSGLLPASICALWLNVPIYTIGEQGQIYPLSNSSEFGGLRMKHFKEKSGHIVIIDDTISTGRSMDSFVSSIHSTESVLKCGLYVRPEKIEDIDIHGMETHHPYLLEWCFFNTSWMNTSLLDFDGIFSPDVPIDVCEDEDKYIEYITNVEPFYHRLPEMFQCRGIVTARLNKYREVTKEWLAKYGVEYDELHMYPTEKEAIRDLNHIAESAAFKSEIYSRSPAKIFVESNQSEAILINRKTKKAVVCPDAERLYK